MQIPILITPKEEQRVSKEEIIKRFGKSLSGYRESTRRLILDAACFSIEVHGDQRRKSGAFYAIHPINVAGILIFYKMDPDTVIAGILHDTLEDTATTTEQLKSLFGQKVASLVEGCTKREVHNSKLKGSLNIRDLLMAARFDIRVLIIKLADKFHNMTTLHFIAPQKQRETAKECLDIFVPLAQGLGMHRMQSELENLAFKILQPESYKIIEHYMNSLIGQQEKNFKSLEKQLYRKAVSRRVKLKIQRRVKSAYSIYKKMVVRGVELEHIYDIVGFRILCKNIYDCYLVLGIIHNIWPPLEGGMKDYIARPKENGYQSLHTVLFFEKGSTMEVQIRTHEMDETAEHGVAAHRLYKNGSSPPPSPGELAFFSRLHEWTDYSSNIEEFQQSLEKEFLASTVTLYTPDGEALTLPFGSTAIDFAYKIHSDIGMHCVAARANGKPIPLNKPLKKGSIITIETSERGEPDPMWLHYAVTSRAREKISHYLRQNGGKKRDSLNEKREKVAVEVVMETLSLPIREQLGKRESLSIRLANCCKPAYGESIVGYLTHHKTVTVHQTECPYLKSKGMFNERKIKVVWSTSIETSYIDFSVTTKHNPQLLTTIEEFARNRGGRITKGEFYENSYGEFKWKIRVETVDPIKRESLKELLGERGVVALNEE